MHTIRQSGGFAGKLIGPLLKTELLLIGNVLTTLAKNILVPLGLTAAARDIAVYKKNFVSGNTTLLISNEKWMILWK